MSDLVCIELPFSGFYNTIHDSNIERAIEDGFNYDYEKQEEKELTDEIVNAIMEVVNWKAVQVEYCKSYAEAFADEFDLHLAFDEMQSPKEYNFTTDRIFCKIPRNEIDKIRKIVEADKEYPEYIKEKYSSRDGFWSHYKSEYKDKVWTRETLDECQYESILIHYLYMLNRNDKYNNREWSEREYTLTEDFEMCNWDSIVEAQKAVEKYLKEKANV